MTVELDRIDIPVVSKYTYNADELVEKLNKDTTDYTNEVMIGLLGRQNQAWNIVKNLTKMEGDLTKENLAEAMNRIHIGPLPYSATCGYELTDDNYELAAVQMVMKLNEMTRDMDKPNVAKPVISVHQRTVYGKTESEQIGKSILVVPKYGPTPPEGARPGIFSGEKRAEYDTKLNIFKAYEKYIRNAEQQLQYEDEVMYSQFAEREKASLDKVQTVLQDKGKRETLHHASVGASERLTARKGKDRDTFFKGISEEQTRSYYTPGQVQRKSSYAQYCTAYMIAEGMSAEEILSATDEQKETIGRELGQIFEKKEPWSQEEKERRDKLVQTVADMLESVYNYEMEPIDITSPDCIKAMERNALVAGTGMTLKQTSADLLNESIKYIAERRGMPVEEVNVLYQNKFTGFARLSEDLNSVISFYGSPSFVDQSFAPKDETLRKGVNGVINCSSQAFHEACRPKTPAMAGIVFTEKGICLNEVSREGNFAKEFMEGRISAEEVRGKIEENIRSNQKDTLVFESAMIKEAAALTQAKPARNRLNLNLLEGIVSAEQPKTPKKPGEVKKKAREPEPAKEQKHEPKRRR